MIFQRTATPPLTSCLSPRVHSTAPFPCTPNPRSTQAFAPLRAFSVDDAEHFLHNHHASVASLRLLFTFVPERRSACHRNRCSPSPECPKTHACDAKGHSPDPQSPVFCDRGKNPLERASLPSMWRTGLQHGIVGSALDRNSFVEIISRLARMPEDLFKP